MKKLLIEVNESEADFVNAMLTEVRRAKAKHPGFVSTLSDAALVIGEETGEVQEAVLKYFYEGGDYANIKKETIEVAATCLRMVEFIEDTVPAPRVMIKNV